MSSAEFLVTRQSQPARSKEGRHKKVATLARSLTDYPAELADEFSELLWLASFLASQPAWLAGWLP